MQSLVVAVVFAATAVEAPVAEVTVYSDRARVTRSGRVPVSGTQQVELPLLLDTVDPATIRVESTGAEVVRIDIVREEPNDLPVNEARALLAELNTLEDKLTALRQQHQAHAQQAEVLLRISPQVPDGDPLKPPPRLESSGWMTALSFIGDSAAQQQERARELAVQIKTLEEKQAQLQEKARLMGGAARGGGYRVRPTLAGNGSATVRMTYFAGPARWVPAYDLQLSPVKGQVQVAFSGMVSQQTGEDWNDARLTLSTAVPATAMKMPELTSWKIGEQDRFMPTPRPKPEFVKPPPQAPPLPPVVDEEEVLRQRLIAAAQGTTFGNVTLDSLGQAGGGQSGAYGQSLSSAEREDRRRSAERSRRSRAQEQRQYAPAAPPPPAAMAAPSAPEEFDFNSDEIEGELAMPDSAAVSEMSSRPGNRDRARRMATSAFSMAPPGVYRRPAYSPELPVSLAGGYDLAWTSLARETVQSGKGTRRVALFAQQWPVSVERRVFPALAKEAYLVAQLKSPSPTPLPGGNAQLFVGADPAGTAKLSLVSPGQSFTLPLGIDRAVKPVRNVELVTVEKGLIGKDDVNKYVVRTELANPYPFPIFVKIFDQWPRTDDDDVEVKLVETRPYAVQDPAKGQLEWHLNVPASGKIEVSFTYTIRRPKNWRLHQK